MIKSSRRSYRRRGFTLVAAALMLPVAVGAVALAVDIGMSASARSDLQRAADAAALAAAQELGRVDPQASIEAAKTVASEYVQLNPAFNHNALDFDPDLDMVFGQGIVTEGSAKVAFRPNEFPATAVQVTVHIDLDYTFGKMLGMSSRRISRSAIATIAPRDFMIVIDVSASMREDTDRRDVAEDLNALGIQYRGDPVRAAVGLQYDGSDPEYAGAYEMGEKFMPPSIRIQPLKATKDAAAYGVQVVQRSGFNDLLGGVAYAEEVEWVEPLTDDYSRVWAKFRGSAGWTYTRIDLGLDAAREELVNNGRDGSNKVILLMTDAREYAGDSYAVAEIAEEDGITIHCVGLGSQVNKPLLDSIAKLTGGSALYVENNFSAEVYGPQLEQAFERIASKVRVMLIQ